MEFPMSSVSRCLLLLSACWLGAASAFAYGPLGHQMVGAIADQRLANTPAGAKVKALLDGMPLETVAVIPDEIKGWDKNGPDDPGIFHYSAHPKIDAQLREFWKANRPTYDEHSAMPSHHWFHYTDVPLVGDEKYADGKTGRSQWDIVHMITFCVNVLRGATPEDNERKITKPIAIILLAHYVGDIHQPLHVGAEYFDAAGKPINPDTTPGALADQGGNTIMLHLPMSLVLAHRRGLKLHGFWDSDAVSENLPQLPETMPKDERSAQTDTAEKTLVHEFATQEPKDWREPATLPLTGYSEAWANEILPISRQAHDRLSFVNIKPRQQNEGSLAAGDADDKPASDGLNYQDWAKKVVRTEIHKAGWRLADVLTRALSAPPIVSPAKNDPDPSPFPAPSPVVIPSPSTTPVLRNPPAIAAPAPTR